MIVMSGAKTVICICLVLPSLPSTWLMATLRISKEVNEMKKNNEVANSSYEANRKIRKDWGDIKPITRVIPNKKKNPRVKHKGRAED